eukprot:g26980.t1
MLFTYSFDWNVTSNLHFAASGLLALALRPKADFQPVIEEVAGFAENQDYGIGFNTWTAGQKGIVIWGFLGLAALGLLSAYSWE